MLSIVLCSPAFFPLSVNKLYLSLVMLLPAFNMKDFQNMCLFVTHRVMAVHGKGGDYNFKKKPFIFYF